MSLTSTFDVLLKEYNTNEMLINEVERISWLFNKLKKKTDWGYGQYQLPLETQEASRFEWGALPAQTDIPKAAYLKPYINAPKQLLGSMIFENADLERNQGDVKKSFLSIMPSKGKQFGERMTEQINMALLGDGSICSLTANGTVGGLVTVGKARVTLFTGGQKISITNSTPATVTGYVRSIDVNSGTFYLYNAATGGAVVDCSAMTTALSAKVYVVGAGTDRCTSLIDICFSAANGGKDTLYGGNLDKTVSPVFQPYFMDLSSYTTGSTLLPAIYDAFYEIEEMGRGSIEKELVVPYQIFKVIAKATEQNRKYEMGKTQSVYGSNVIELTGPHGVMTLRAARGVPSTKGLFLDYSALAIISRGDVIKNANVEGQEFFTIRNTTGYQFVMDKKAEFELAVLNPQRLGGVAFAASVT